MDPSTRTFTRSTVEDETTASPPTENAPPPSTPLQRKSSISEVATEAHTPRCAPPGWFASIFEFPFRVKNPITGLFLPEATGWAMDAASRGPLNQVGGFVGTAILRMAIREAGCTSNSDCRLGGGLRATSLLTLASAIVGVATAIIMPFMGAVVDHTPYRRLVGIGSAFCVVVFTGLYMTVSESDGNWRFILVVDSLQSFFVLIHTTGSFSYLPDLSTEEEAIIHYTASFSVRQFAMQLVYALAVLVLGLGRDRSIASSVRLARDASAISFGIAAVLFFYSWTFLFKPRPRLSKVPVGETLLSTGFRQVQSTTLTIAREYKALKWFMISLLWSPEHGAGVVLAIVVSWLISEVGFTGQDMAIVNVILLATSVLGSIFSRLIVRRIDSLNSYRIGMFSLACIIAVTVAVVRGPDRRNAVFGLTVGWGTILGWVFTSQRVLYCTLIPKGQEYELMGLFTFLGQILGWLPPLLVTIMNESGISLRFGLLLESGFCLLALACTMPMGDYKAATDMATNRSEQKLSEVKLATMKSTKSPDVPNDDNSV